MQVADRYLQSADFRFQWSCASVHLCPRDARYIREEVRKNGFVIMNAELSASDQENNEKLLAFGRAVGTPKIYEGEDYIVNVHPSRELAEGEISSKSHNDFKLHTDLAYSTTPPDYLALLVVRQDPKGEAKSRFSSLNEAIDHLKLNDIEELLRPSFRFSSPVRAGYERNFSEALPVLTPYENGNYRVRYRNDIIIALTAGAERALRNLGQALEKAAVEFLPPAGTFIMVDNRNMLHARTAFTPTYDNNDRLLKRAHLTADM